MINNNNNIIQTIRIIQITSNRKLIIFMYSMIGKKNYILMERIYLLTI